MRPRNGSGRGRDLNRRFQNWCCGSALCQRAPAAAAAARHRQVWQPQAGCAAAVLPPPLSASLTPSPGVTCGAGSKRAFGKLVVWYGAKVQGAGVQYARLPKHSELAAVLTVPAVAQRHLESNIKREHVGSDAVAAAGSGWLRRSLCAYCTSAMDTVTPHDGSLASAVQCIISARATALSINKYQQAPVTIPLQNKMGDPDAVGTKCLVELMAGGRVTTWYASMAKLLGSFGLTYWRGLDAELEAAQELHDVRLRRGAAGALARKEGAPLLGQLQEQGWRLEGGYQLLHEAHLHGMA